MVALLIILTIILILLIRVHICLKFDEKKFSGFARILFYKYKFPPNKKKSVSKTKKTENADKKTRGSLEVFKSIVSPIFKTLGKLVGMLSFDHILADIRLAGSDACQTAMMYGGACAGISTVLPFLENNLRIKKKNISISADFENSESTIYLEVDISISLYKLIFLAVYFLVKYKKEKERA